MPSFRGTNVGLPLLHILFAPDGYVSSHKLPAETKRSLGSSMRMPVMDVGEVRMGVCNRQVVMGMRVWLLTVPRKVVRVLVMLVMSVSMVVI